MSDQLREALRELAEDAQTVGPRPDVWRRARRSHRGRLAGAGLAAALVVLAGFVTWNTGTSSTSTPPAPASYNPADLAIPNRVWTPSPWTPGTDRAGPLGPLAFIAQATRRTSWFHTDTDAFFGVSASTGQYRFLDLPGEASDASAEPALSPDGTRVVYFVTGTPAAPDAPSDIVGFAMYSSVTGGVRRFLIPTRYGLGGLSLTWSGDGREVIAVFDQSTAVNNVSHTEPPEAWNVQTGQSRVLHPRDFLGFGHQIAPANHDLAAFVGVAPRLALIDPVTGDVTGTPLDQDSLVGVGAAGAPLLSPTGDAVVFQAEPESTGIGGLYQASWTPGQTRSAPVTHVPGTKPFVLDVFGWLDDQHVLVMKWSSGTLEGGSTRAPQIYSVDVQTGVLKPEIAVGETGQSWVDPSFAKDLLLRPFVPAHEPAAPHDPREVWGITGGIMLILVGALAWYLRRRVAFASMVRPAA